MPRTPGVGQTVKTEEGQAQAQEVSRTQKADEDNKRTADAKKARIPAR